MSESESPSALEGRIWFVFSSHGTASMAVGDDITKAIRDWRKRKGKTGADILGVIKASVPLTVERMHMESTRIYGVICCVQNEDRKP